MARAAGSSAEGELAQKRCLPCEKDSGLQALSRDAVPPLQAQLDSAWAVQEDADGRLHLHRQWRAKNFLAGLELCRRFGDVAEAEGHHPDLHLTGWNKLDVDVSTHSLGGLTENDFILASKLDRVDTEGLLRKPKQPSAS